MKTFEEEREELLKKAEYLKKQSRAESRASRARMEQNQSRNQPVLRSESRVSAGGLSNLSFLSSQRGVSRAPDRNRFFSPKAVDLPQIPQEESETIKIKKFYKEYCQVVKKNLTPDKQIYLVDVLE